KRYKFTGKERDEETGFGHHGARYYVPWLGRWVSCDPAGIGAGLNLYLYADASPVCLIDDDGMDPGHPEDGDKHQVWTEGQPSQSAPPPEKAAPANPPVEPDIVMEVPITGEPVDSFKRGFDKKMGQKAVYNRARMVGGNPRDFHLGHEKDNVLLMPGEK